MAVLVSPLPSIEESPSSSSYLKLSAFLSAVPTEVPPVPARRLKAWAPQAFLLSVERHPEAIAARALIWRRVATASDGPAPRACSSP